MEFIYAIVLLLIILLLIIKIISNKINKLEKIIDLEFKKRNNQVSFLYIVTRENISMGNEVFKNIFDLRKKEFGEDSHDVKFINKIKTYEKIHNELNFIFKIVEKHKDINGNEKFLYIKDSILEKSSEIGIHFELYKRLTNISNKFIIVSKIFIIGLLLGLETKRIS